MKFKFNITVNVNIKRELREMGREIREELGIRDMNNLTDAQIKTIARLYFDGRNDFVLATCKDKDIKIIK